MSKEPLHLRVCKLRKEAGGAATCGNNEAPTHCVSVPRVKVNKGVEMEK